MRAFLLVTLICTPLVAAGCAPGGILGDVLETVIYDPLPRAGSSQVAGQVSGVDGRRQRLEVRDRSHRVVRAYYDRNTRVIRGGRQYGINGLRRGDHVTMRVHRERGGLYTSLIHVQAQHARGARLGRSAEGRVGRVWRNRATFELDTRHGSVIVVPHRNLSRREIDRVRRLRPGDYVRVEGRQIDRDRYEMRRLR